MANDDEINSQSTLVTVFGQNKLPIRNNWKLFKNKYLHLRNKLNEFSDWLKCLVDLLLCNAITIC